MFNTQTPEQAEQDLEKLFRDLEHWSRVNPEFGSRRLRQILYFDQRQQVALLAGAVQILVTEVEGLRVELETERAGKNSTKASRPSGEKRPSLSSRIGLDRRVVPEKVKEPEPVQNGPVAAQEPLPEFVRIPGEGSRLVVGSRVVAAIDVEKKTVGMVTGFQRGRDGIQVLVQFGGELPRPLPPESLRPAIPLPSERGRKAS